MPNPPPRPVFGLEALAPFLMIWLFLENGFKCLETMDLKKFGGNPHSEICAQLEYLPGTPCLSALSIASLFLRRNVCKTWPGKDLKGRTNSVAYNQVFAQGPLVHCVKLLKLFHKFGLSTKLAFLHLELSVHIFLCSGYSSYFVVVAVVVVAAAVHSRPMLQWRHFHRPAHRQMRPQALLLLLLLLLDHLQRTLLLLCLQAHLPAQCYQINFPIPCSPSLPRQILRQSLPSCLQLKRFGAQGPPFIRLLPLPPFSLAFEREIRQEPTRNVTTQYRPTKRMNHSLPSYLPSFLSFIHSLYPSLNNQIKPSPEPP